MKHHDIVVFYHKDCFDGFGAAYAAWKKFKDKAAYVGLGHSQDPVNVKGKKEIYFLDYCYSKEIMDEISSSNDKVVVIDHHITNEKTVKSVPEHSYDVEHSGAYLSWKYFHPSKNVPRIVTHIEDQDLWKFNLPFSKEVNTLLDLYDFDFKVWDKLIKEFEIAEKRKKYIESGKMLLRYKKIIVKKIVDKADKGIFENHEAGIVNSMIFASEVGNALVEAGHKIAIIWNQRGGETYVSLRSDKKGGVDVSELAAKYGGGGHKAASGFGLKADQKFPWIYNNE